MNCTGSPRSREMSAIIPGVSSACRESFSISVVSRAELSGCAPWTSTFADQRKDHRYYEILDDTLRGNFEYRYFAIVDNNGQVRAIQPFFLVDQDILEGLGAERIHWISLVRRFYPRFLKLRFDGWLFGRGGSPRSYRNSACRHHRGDLVKGHRQASEIAQRATHRAEGISFSLSQSTSLLRAMRLRACAQHADDDARHRI